MFRGSLVGEIARMALRKDRGPHVDNSIGILFLVVWWDPIERGRD